MSAYLEIGDRASLTTMNYGASPINPVIFSKYGCIGTVIVAPEGTNSVQIRWDNGKINSYNTYDLKPIISDESLNNKYRSIW